MRLLCRGLTCIFYIKQRQFKMSWCIHFFFTGFWTRWQYELQTTEETSNTTGRLFRSIYQRRTIRRKWFMVCVVKTLSEYVIKSFILYTPVSHTSKTDSHDITEILFKVALNSITNMTYFHYKKQFLKFQWQFKF